MNITCWKVDLERASARQVLEWCLRAHQVDRLLLVTRAERQRGRWEHYPPGFPARIRLLFSSRVLQEFFAVDWPGSRTPNKQAGHVFVVRFDETVQEMILRMEPDLTKWRRDFRPALPEDLCLFRAKDSHPVFISVTHEHLGWLLTHKRPRLRGVARSDHSEETYHQCAFVKGPYFCQRWEERKRPTQVWIRGRWIRQTYRKMWAK